MAHKTIDEKIDDLARAVNGGFEAVDKRFEAVDKKFEALEKKIDLKISALPDKAYLDDKMADLKGDLAVKLRREDEKVNFLIDLLRERSVLTPADVARLRREFEIFPYLAR